ncbi:MAG: transporter [Variovorax paradoxus]|uniref:Transporter n=1 Tax=Variovorax paradoxus TaxID=34073 RepID=A0A2W5SQJ7_VARPD|nr:MAG: transporter [Variovorax paradoxus]
MANSIRSPCLLPFGQRNLMLIMFSLSARRTMAAIVLAFAATCPALAQTPPSDLPSVLGLEDLVQTILAYNPALLSAEQARATASAAVLSAQALPNPRLELGNGRQRGIQADATAGTLRSWGVSQLIENPALRSARVDAAKFAERGSRQSAAVVRNTLVAEVHVRAYEYLLRRAEADAAADALGLLEQVQARVTARVATGEAPRYELIKAESEVINARQVRDTSMLMVEQAKFTLNRLAAGHLPLNWTLREALTDVAPLPPSETLIEEASARNPELLALRAEVDRARANVTGARASRWPGVEIGYQQTRDPDVRQSMVSVGIQVPLFDQRNGPIAEASSERARALGRLEGRELELRQQILQAAQMLEIITLKVRALSTGSILEAEAALQVAEAAYRYGERGILDVLDAQRVLRTVRADLLAAQFQLQTARIEIELLAGRYAGEPSKP